jgi:hypothetical protein
VRKPARQYRVREVEAQARAACAGKQPRARNPEQITMFDSAGNSHDELMEPLGCRSL